MIPLIDAMFLLLVFFIYTMLSMTTHHAIPVNLPNASSAEISRDDFTIITLDKNSQLFLDKEPVTRKELISHLKDPALKDHPIYLNGDWVVPTGELVELLDLLRQNGIDKVSIGTKERER